MLKLVNNSVYFDIVITALSFCLNELNVHHEVVENYPLHDKDNIYLICTPHELDKPLPKRYISYNFEQLTTSKIWEETFLYVYDVQKWFLIIVKIILHYYDKKEFLVIFYH